MEKTVNAVLPETRLSEEVYIENGIVVVKKIKEVIVSKKVEESIRPLSDISKDMLFCCHMAAIPVWDVNAHFELYYTDIIKGADILKHILDEDEEHLREEVDVAIVRADKSIDFVEACFSTLYYKQFCIRPEREYRFMCIHHKAKDIYSFDIHKTNFKMFNKEIRIY